MFSHQLYTLTVIYIAYTKHLLIKCCSRGERLRAGPPWVSDVGVAFNNLNSKNTCQREKVEVATLGPCKAVKVPHERQQLVCSRQKGEEKRE